MKLTVFLFAFILNLSYSLLTKAEVINDSSGNPIKNSFKEEPLLNKQYENNKIHIVKVGDTISSISKLYSVKKELIIKLNNLKDENYIYVGQNLKVSEINQKTINKKNKLNEGNINYHIVQKGDNLTEISNKYGLNLAYLIEINQLEAPESIEVGKKLLIRKSNPKEKRTTIVIKDENINQLNNIAKKTYGPITTQQNELTNVSGRKIINVLNQNNKKLIISINCETKDLDVRIPYRKWRGWRPAEKEFKKNLIMDFCQKF